MRAEAVPRAVAVTRCAQLDEFDRLVGTPAERVPRTEAALVEAPWPGGREPESQRARTGEYL